MLKVSLFSIKLNSSLNSDQLKVVPLHVIINLGLCLLLVCIYATLNQNTRNTLSCISGRVLFDIIIEVPGQCPFCIMDISHILGTGPCRRMDK
jgi:hypothetical protein